LYLVFSSALAVTGDTEHFLFNARALKISDTNLRRKKYPEPLGKQHPMCPTVPEQPPTKEHLKPFM
jgi:hypothetical protein